MTIDSTELERLLGVKCDGVFPCTRWVNFTDVDPASDALGASFCILADFDQANRPSAIPLARIQQARDLKRAQFRRSLAGLDFQIA